MFWVDFLWYFTCVHQRAVYSSVDVLWNLNSMDMSHIFYKKSYKILDDQLWNLSYILKISILNICRRYINPRFALHKQNILMRADPS